MPKKKILFYGFIGTASAFGFCFCGDKKENFKNLHFFQKIVQKKKIFKKSVLWFQFAGTWLFLKKLPMIWFFVRV